TVAALGQAADAGRRTGPPDLEQAVRRATVARAVVAVVALLAGLDPPVAADDRGDAALARRGAGVVGLHRAVGGAAVAGGAVAVIALLAVGGVDDRVTAGERGAGVAGAARTVGALGYNGGVGGTSILAPAATALVRSSARASHHQK